MSVPDPSDVRWRKSSRSGGQGGDCVEVAAYSCGIAIRDSKHPQGPKLAFASVAWLSFAERVKANEYDLG